MNNVILICGKAGSGKNQLAEYLKEQLDREKNGEVLEKTLIRNNAQSVKDIATKKFNWNGEKDGIGRQLLLDITRVGYRKDPFYWENETFTEAIMHKEFENRYCNYLIIPDWRYQQTEDYFRDKVDNITTIRIVRPNQEEGTHSTHSSENDLNSFKVDIEIVNNKPLNVLERVAQQLAVKIRRK